MFTLHNNLKHKEDGFGLIELLVVVIIIGILAAIAVPIYLNQRKAAAYSGLQNDIRIVTLAATTFQTMHNGMYPTTCADWVSALGGQTFSPSTAAIGTTVSPDGKGIWVEAQAVGFGAGGSLPTSEIDQLTAVYNSLKGTGIMSRSEYMGRYAIFDRTRLHKESGYTNAGFHLTTINNGTCQAWSTTGP